MSSSSTPPPNPSLAALLFTVRRAVQRSPSRTRACHRCRSRTTRTSLATRSSKRALSARRSPPACIQEDAGNFAKKKDAGEVPCMHLYSFYLFLLNISMHAYLFHLICNEYNAMFFLKAPDAKCWRAAACKQTCICVIAGRSN